MTLGRQQLCFDADVPVEERIAAVAEAQHGPISTAQLCRCGLSQSGIERRSRTGALHRLHRGVYLPGHRRLPPLGWIAGSVLACGMRASTCRLTAAKLRELRFSARMLVDVAVHSPAGRCHHHVVTYSARNLRPQDVSVVDGIPATSVARTLLDCAPVLGRRGTEKLLAEAEHRGTIDMAALHDLLAHVPGHPGRAILRAAIGDAASAQGRTRSDYEDGMLVEFRGLGLAEPECNQPVLLPDGAVVYPDFLWRREGLVVEADPRSTHDSTASYRSDRVRDRKLDAIGLQTMRFNDEDLRDLRACALEVGGRLVARRAEGNHEFHPLSGQNS